MRIDITDLFERGKLTMQMEDIVDTLSLWQTIRLYLFCRQTRTPHRVMFGVDWTRSEQVEDQPEGTCACWPECLNGTVECDCVR